MNQPIRIKLLSIAAASLGLAFCFIQSAPLVMASDLTLHLHGGASMIHKLVRYVCDAGASKLGLSSGPFTVEYVTGGENGLALLPIDGNALIFVSGQTDSEVRRVAKDYVWCQMHRKSSRQTPRRAPVFARIVLNRTDQVFMLSCEHSRHCRSQRVVSSGSRT
jgi:hypothetical protein